ncbi:MAG: YfaZ family protein [Gallionella sp.]|nr:YfaZ family protein [Gallionella sp.]
MLLRHIVAFALLATSTAVWADTVDVNLRSHGIQMQYGFPVNEDNPEKSAFHAGAIYNSDGNMIGEFGVLFKKLGSNASSASTASHTSSSMFILDAGFKGVAVNTKPTTASAIPLGIHARFSSSAIPRYGIAGQYYYAPLILTTSGADRYTEGSLRVEYEVTPYTIAYAGYRKITLGYKLSPNVKLDSGYHIGVQVSF